MSNQQEPSDYMKEWKLSFDTGVERITTIEQLIRRCDNCGKKKLCKGILTKDYFGKDSPAHCCSCTTGDEYPDSACEFCYFISQVIKKGEL